MDSHGVAVEDVLLRMYFLYFIQLDLKHGCITAEHVQESLASFALLQFLQESRQLLSGGRSFCDLLVSGIIRGSYTQIRTVAETLMDNEAKFLGSAHEICPPHSLSTLPAAIFDIAPL
ncbi:hypothetical protein JDV02_003098 [Purpureocillium takamizusanense]|uniref:Uncharacterized protein n=1 Tax=Purpureocillium takamizusanense TaxID=2060973 RepID=A0A9Q8V9B2_9HYPO|nr:uncharacterized protein JDV02_003098 [Purpureocillium takamizusanense]UNI16684.1 hypothetical protein JDV02_003098 [Purpureocillium takamizusanense]